jgi:translation initiation factor IF-3
MRTAIEWELFLTRDAVNIANERGLDLIEVAPNASPPVCKMGDYGRMMYEKKKKESKSRKNQTVIQIKEVKLTPKTSEHDFQVKLRHSRRFINNGDKVKVTIRFRGREMAHQEFGKQQCMKLFEEVRDIAKIEVSPRMDGRHMQMIIAPIKAK